MSNSLEGRVALIIGGSTGTTLVVDGRRSL
jgi:hypothetical protein